MARPLVSDELWEALQPLLPPPKPRRFRYPGRKPVGHRQALTGILFVLKTGTPWEAPRRDGLRLRHDLLAPPARLARGRRLAPAPPGPVAAPRRRRADRLVAGGRGRHLRPGLRRRRGERPQPHGPRAPRGQAVRRRGRPGPAPGRGRDGGRRPGGQGTCELYRGWF